MAKPLKIALITLGALLALLLGTAIALPLLFDPNDHRDTIIKVAKEETGRDLALGDIGLSVFPWIAISLEGVSLSNAVGFGDEPFAALSEARVGVKLLPLLLDRRIEVSTVTLNGLRLNAAVNAEGKNNWDDLAKPKQEEPQPETPAEEKKPFDLSQIDIGGIAIQDAAVRYSDAQQNKTYSIERLNLNTGAVRLGEPLELEASLRAGASDPQAVADIELVARVLADLTTQNIQAEGLKLRVVTGGEETPNSFGARADVTVGGNANVDLKAQVADVSGLTVSFAGGNKDIDAQADVAAALKAQFGSGLYEVSGLTLKATARGDSLPGKSQTLNLNSDIRFNLADGSLQLNNTALKAAGLSVKADIRGEGLLGDNPKLSGPLRVEPFSPRELLKTLAIPLETTDPQALQTASLSAQYSGGFNSASLSDLKLVLDQTSATGSVNVRDFATQAVQFSLRVDQIDADRYMPPPSATAAPEPEKKDGGSLNDIQIPAEVINQLNAEGSVDIGTLKVKGLKVSDVRLQLAGGRGALKKQTVSAKLYGGSVTLRNQVTPGSKPAYGTQLQLAALTAGPLLKDFIGKDWVNGLGSLNVDLGGNGLTVGDLRRSLNGDLGLKLEQGAVKGFNLSQIISKGQALFAGTAPPAETGPQQTDFSAISLAAKIVNGVLKTKALEGSSSLFRFAGEGEIDLFEQTINFLAKPTVQESATGSKVLEELRGLAVPIKLSGNLLSPSYRVDIAEALKQKATAAGKEKLKAEEDRAKEKLKEKIDEKLGPGMSDLLRGLRKKKEPAAEPAPAETPPPPAS